MLDVERLRVISLATSEASAAAAPALKSRVEERIKVLGDTLSEFSREIPSLPPTNRAGYREKAKAVKDGLHQLKNDLVGL